MLHRTKSDMHIRMCSSFVWTWTEGMFVDTIVFDRLRVIGLLGLIFTVYVANFIKKNT